MTFKHLIPANYSFRSQQNKSCGKNHETARLYSSFLCLFTAPQEALRSHPMALESSPFIWLLSHFLSSVLVLIIIALQWFLTATVNTGNMGSTVAFTGLKSQSCHHETVCKRREETLWFFSREPQASRWFIYQHFFWLYPRVSGCAHFSPLIIYSHAVWCTVQNYSSDLPAGKKLKPVVCDIFLRKQQN